jgi:hypothetical protein
MEDETKNIKNKHSKILQQENSKSKKKRVSFSIFTANTIDEMRDLRMEKEKEFLNLLQMRTKANESFKPVPVSKNF